MAKKYLGYQPQDYATDYAKYYDETIQPVPDYVQSALDNAPLSVGALPPFSQAKDLQKEGYTAIETGYTLESDGSAHVAVLTKMPNVTPDMWDWWFAWHGCKDNRYKLWHPKSHYSAQWEDGRDDVAYIGRNSIIAEMIGDDYTQGAIQFKSPTEFGFSDEAIGDSSKAVYICARIGHQSLPVDYGYLIHQVRAVEGGAEMRSRFWVGGPYIHIRKQQYFFAFFNQFYHKKVVNQDESIN